MKRYLLFAGWEYYPLGGWDDLYTTFDNKDNALQKSLNLLDEGQGDWVQVVDSVTGEVLFKAP